MAPISKGAKPNGILTTLLSFKLIGGSISELESGNQNVGQLHGETYAPTGANFESNLAQVVFYHPVKFQMDRRKGV